MARKLGVLPVCGDRADSRPARLILTTGITDTTVRAASEARLGGDAQPTVMMHAPPTLSPPPVADPPRRSAAAAPKNLTRPDFVIIGAPKAGTTTLHQTLSRHGDLFLTDPKEPDYYGAQFERGRDWYASLFADARDGQLLGEASTNYSVGTIGPNGCDVATVARRLADDAPDVKLIYILRHPVERAYSFYVEQVRTAQALGQREGFGQTFEQYMQIDPRCVEGSRYIDVIETYRRHFDDAQMLIITMDELKADPAKLHRRVTDFLGITPLDELEQEAPVVANNTKQRHESMLRDRLIAPLRRIPVVGQLGAALPRPCRDGIYRLLSRSGRAKRMRQQLTCPPMLAQTRAVLLDELREPTLALAGELDCDLSSLVDMTGRPPTPPLCCAHANPSLGPVDALRPVAARTHRAGFLRR